MHPDDVVALVRQLTCTDPATCDVADLAALVRVSERVRGWLDALDARIAIHVTRLAETGS